MANESPNVIAAILALVFLAVSIVALLRFLRMADDIQKIREHLDRAVPDYIRDRKARVREKVAVVQGAAGAPEE